MFAYKEESGELELHCEEDCCNNWVRKFCNSKKTTTGSTWDLVDCVHCCIAIEQCIQCKMNSGIIGTLSAQEDDTYNKDEDSTQGILASLQNLQMKQSMVAMLKEAHWKLSLLMKSRSFPQLMFPFLCCLFWMLSISKFLIMKVWTSNSYNHWWINY